MEDLSDEELLHIKGDPCGITMNQVLRAVAEIQRRRPAVVPKHHEMTLDEKVGTEQK